MLCISELCGCGLCGCKLDGSVDEYTSHLHVEQLAVVFFPTVCTTSFPHKRSLVLYVYCRPTGIACIRYGTPIVVLVGLAYGTSNVRCPEYVSSSVRIV